MSIIGDTSVMYKTGIYFMQQQSTVLANAASSTLSVARVRLKMSCETLPLNVDISQTELQNRGSFCQGCLSVFRALFALSCR